jgi:uncharacterized protein
MAVLRPLLCLVALLFAAPAAAQEYPALSGRVVDQADLLSVEQEHALTVRLEELERANSRQLVVATVASLQDRTVEDYANGLFRHWRLGQAEADNGVLLLVAPSERKVRIEVGYGLEPILTDALTGQIIRDLILPRFRDDDYAGGIEAGAGALIEQLQAPPEAAEQRARAAAAPQAPADDGGSLPPMLLLIIILVFVILPIAGGAAMSFGRGRRTYGRRYRSRDGAAAVGEILLWAALDQLAHGGGRGGWGAGGRWGRGSSWGGGGGSWGGGSWGGGGGFSGGGGSSGGGGASGSW